MTVIYEEQQRTLRAVVSATAISALIAVSMWRAIPPRSPAIASGVSSDRAWRQLSPVVPHERDLLQHVSLIESPQPTPSLSFSSPPLNPTEDLAAAFPQLGNLPSRSLLPASILTRLSVEVIEGDMSARMLAGLELGASPSPASPAIVATRPAPRAFPISGQLWAAARLLHWAGPWLAEKTSFPAASPAEVKESSPLVLGPPVKVGSCDDRLAYIPREVSLVKPSPASKQAPGDFYSWIEPHVSREIESRAREPWLPRPTALVHELRQLTCEPLAAQWAGDVLHTFESLDNTFAPGGMTQRQGIERLASLSLAGQQLADEVDDAGLAVRIRQTSYALWRRVGSWHAAADVLQPPSDRIALAAGSVSVLKRVVRQADEGLATSDGLAPSEINRLLTTIERFESKGLDADSQYIAMNLDRLAAASHPAQQQLAESLEGNYRNANLRIALSHEMIERWLSKQSTTREGVSDRILGTPVRGVATVDTHTSVRLVPDDAAWRLVLVARGDIESSTIARQGNVRVHSFGTSRFVVNQQMVIDQEGLRRGEARANAISSSQFAGASSSYDRLPLVGSIVRSKARDTFFERQAAAAREVEAKTAAKTRTTFEARIAEAVARSQAEFHEQVLQRLESAGVTAEPVEWRTTSSRLITRVRLSQPGMLTAHTPRPRAPGDSVASLQLHESALRTLAAGLHLDGERLTTAELKARYQEAFGRDLAPDKSESESAIIEFAPQQALDVKLQEGRVHVIVAIREIVVRGNTVRDFKVHTYYTPQVDGLAVKLVPTEGPHFEGSLRNRQRMQLHAIFGKGKDDRNGIELGRTWLGDPRLEGLAVTQFVIDDGWLGVALGSPVVPHTAQVDRYRPIW